MDPEIERLLDRAAELHREGRLIEAARLDAEAADMALKFYAKEEIRTIPSTS